MEARNRIRMGLSYRPASTGIFKQSVGPWKRVEIWLSYRPARLHSLAELVPWNRFLGSLKFKKLGSWQTEVWLEWKAVHSILGMGGMGRLFNLISRLHVCLSHLNRNSVGLTRDVVRQLYTATHGTEDQTPLLMSSYKEVRKAHINGTGQLVLPQDDRILATYIEGWLIYVGSLSVLYSVLSHKYTVHSHPNISLPFNLHLLTDKQSYKLPISGSFHDSKRSPCSLPFVRVFGLGHSARRTHREDEGGEGWKKMKWKKWQETRHAYGFLRFEH
jgi:hypothetical protein